MKYLNTFDSFNPLNEDRDDDYKPSYYTDDDAAFQRKMRMKQLKKTIGKPVPMDIKFDSSNLKAYSPIKNDDMPLDKYLQSVKDKEEKIRQQNIPIPNFTLKEVKDEIKKYTTQKEFIQNSPLYYKWIKKHEKQDLFDYYYELREKEIQKNRKLKEKEIQKEKQKKYNLIYKIIDKCKTLDEFEHNYPNLYKDLNANIHNLDKTKLKKFFSYLNGKFYVKNRFTEIIEKMFGFRYYSNFALLYPEDAKWLYEIRNQKSMYSLQNDINSVINIQITDGIVANNIQMTDEELQYVIDNTKNCTEEKIDNVILPCINGETKETGILKNIVYAIIINKIQLVDNGQIFYERLEKNKIFGLKRKNNPQINRDIFYTLEEAVNAIPDRFKN